MNAMKGREYIVNVSSDNRLNVTVLKGNEEKKSC